MRGELRIADCPATARSAVTSGLRICVAALCVAACGCERKSSRPSGPAAGAAQMKTITTRTGIEMVLIPAGEFVMGDDAGEADERPAHKVRLRAFYMDRHEVTQQAYESLMGRNPARFSKPKAPDRPVERVSWHAAAKFCNMRSLREGLTPCYDARTLACDFDANGYRLPTEAEWEYACRAGATEVYSFGPDSRLLAEHAWFKDNAGKTTRPVGGRKPNAWGLYDMHGNVAEWCQDFYGEAYYRASPPAEPRGPQAGEDRVLRGGSWKSPVEACRSPARAAESPGFADVCLGYDAYGFRCVRGAPGGMTNDETRMTNQ